LEYGDVLHGYIKNTTKTQLHNKNLLITHFYSIMLKDMYYGSHSIMLKDMYYGMYATSSQ